MTRMLNQNNKIMNRTRTLLNVVLFLFISYCFVSCNAEDRKIKKTLKEYALKNGSKYKLTEYRIIETIMKSNLEDSIKKYEVAIEVEKEMMTMDSLMLNKYIAEREQCKKQQRNTVWHLSSSYNSIINDWQRMIDEQEDKLKEKQKNINNFKVDVNFWKLLVHKAETPIVFYIIKHNFVLDEKHIESNVFLTTEYEVIKYQ